MMNQLVNTMMTPDNLQKWMDPPLQYMIHKMTPYIIILNIIIITTFFVIGAIGYYIYIKLVS
jgi:hypothetical protein